MKITKYIQFEVFDKHKNYIFIVNNLQNIIN